MTTLYKNLALLCLLQIPMLCNAADQPSRYILSDFEDVGTWRTQAKSGMDPTEWFSAGMYLSSSKAEKCEDEYVGEIAFTPEAGTGPKEVLFERARMSEVSAFMDAIEFKANPKNVTCSIAFLLMDATGRTFRTAGVPISGNTWKSYTVQVNAETVSKFSEMRSPICIRGIALQTNESGPGRRTVYLDDVTIIGTVPRDRQISIRPVYQDIIWDPSRPVQTTYRVRNADGQARTVRLSLRAEDQSGKAVFQKNQTVEVPAYGKALASFDLGQQQAGSYALTINAESGNSKLSQLDWVGVATLNGKRTNHLGMKFGVQDLTIWQGLGENLLHRDWMRRIGIDINRIMVTGGRLEPKQNRMGTEGVCQYLADHEKDGIEVSLLYLSVPGWMQNKPNVRRPPDNYDDFAEHIRQIGSALAPYPSLQYFEFWNEPEIGFFEGSLDEYLKMLQVFHDALKPIAPKVKIGSGTATGTDHPKHKKGFEDLYYKGAPWYDVAMFHSHGTVDRYEEEQRRIVDSINKGTSRRPIANTESGERAGYSIPGAWNQADTLIKKITYARYQNTEFYTWFTLQDYWDMDWDCDDSFGLVTCDNRPKPSFVAYNELIRQLSNTLPAPKALENSAITSYRFVNPNTKDEVTVCWPAQDSHPVLLALTSDAAIHITDSFGRAMQGSAPGEVAFVPVERHPVYISTRKDSLKAVDMSFVDCPSQIAAPPGSSATLKLKLANIWDKPARFSGRLVTQSGTTSAIRDVELAPHEKGELVLTTPIDKNAAFGSSDTKLELHVHGPKEMTIPLPVALLASYPIDRSQTPLPLDPSKPIAPEMSVIRLTSLEDVHEITHDPKIRQWNGADDLSVVASAVHDDSGILFLFDVTDDKHVPASDDRLWNGDSVQLSVEAQRGSLLELSAALTNAGPKALCTRDPNSPVKEPWKHPFQAVRQGNKTTYRLYVPYSELGIATNNASIRFAFIINENDGDGRVRWLHWFDGIGKSKNPTEFGYGLIR